MIVHAIVDYSFLYYKYKFQLDSGKMRRLTTAIDWKGAVIEKDISQIYYSIKEIEGFRRKLETAGHNVFVSVCFDMKSARKKQSDETSADAADKYKSNRVKRLSDEDFENIQFVEKLLSDSSSRSSFDTLFISKHSSSTEPILFKCAPIVIPFSAKNCFATAPAKTIGAVSLPLK